MAAENGRPAKRQKTGDWNGKAKKNEGKSRYRSQAAYAAGKGNMSATGLMSGDVGIFATCDKGKEKSCLREMEDLLSEELGLGEEPATNDVTIAAEHETVAEGEAGTKLEVSSEPLSIPDSRPPQDDGIEAEIQRELAEMASSNNNSTSGHKRKHDQDSPLTTTNNSTNKLGLVTLDIPCVVFLRFPTNTTHDPVTIATKLCRDAKNNPLRQRSRFIKRLTPLSKVRKVMSGGIEELCKEVLPPVFGAGDGGVAGWRYAVRVTVRNNNQIEREEVIKTVAGAVKELGLDEEGKERHKVDLKGYQRLVLVEIYRNVVGMAVVGDEWEALRRFNLAEIYADGRKAVDEGREAGDGEGAGDEGERTR